MFSREKIKRYNHQRAGFIVTKLLLFFMAKAMMIILLWLRIDWSITNWAHHAYFSHFWSGVYICFAGFSLCLLNSLLACCFVMSSSNKLLVMVTIELYLLPTPYLHTRAVYSASPPSCSSS